MMEAKRCFCGKARPSYAAPGSNEPSHCARQACCSAAATVTAQQRQVLLWKGAATSTQLRHLLGCCHFCFTTERALPEWMWSAWLPRMPRLMCQPEASEHGL